MNGLGRHSNSLVGNLHLSRSAAMALLVIGVFAMSCSSVEKKTMISEGATSVASETIKVDETSRSEEAARRASPEDLPKKLAGGDLKKELAKTFEILEELQSRSMPWLYDEFKSSKKPLAFITWGFGEDQIAFSANKNILSGVQSYQMDNHGHLYLGDPGSSGLLKVDLKSGRALGKISLSKYGGTAWIDRETQEVVVEEGSEYLVLDKSGQEIVRRIPKSPGNNMAYRGKHLGNERWISNGKIYLSRTNLPCATLTGEGDCTDASNDLAIEFVKFPRSIEDKLNVFSLKGFKKFGFLCESIEKRWMT